MQVRIGAWYISIMGIHIRVGVQTATTLLPPVAVYKFIFCYKCGYHNTGIYPYRGHARLTSLTGARPQRQQLIVYHRSL